MQSNSLYVLDRPELASLPRKAVELGVTFVAWALWMYMVAPLVTLLLWAFGIREVMSDYFSPEGFSALLGVLKYYSIGMAVLLFMILAWSIYNLRRFGRYDRRRSAAPVTDEELSGMFRIPVDEIVRARNLKNVSVNFSENHLKFKQL